VQQRRALSSLEARDMYSVNGLTTFSPIISFVLLWVAFSLGFAIISGWRRLAGVYRLQSTFAGDRLRFRSARMRGSYDRYLTLGADEHGFYMAIPFPFGLFNPPLLIPWTDIGVTRKGGGWSYMYLDIATLKSP
jgi:hypothetical protein